MRSPFIGSSSASGFTLIEMMLAVSLGLAVVYVAFAGFRVAAQAVTITNRLATENAMMRAGCDMAHHRLDYWTDYDDPSPGGEVPKLRGANVSTSGNEGMPFTPMSEVMPLVRNAVQPERATGWDPNESWSASDPRTWWHGNVAEKFQSDLTLGRYGIFANTRSNVTITYVDPRMPPARPMMDWNYGNVEVPHSWQYNQVWSLHRALGYYGFADYLPANTLFACYRDFVPDMPGLFGTSFDGMPLVLFRPGSSFDNGEGGQEYPKGIWRLTMASSYAVISPTGSATPSPGAHQKKYVTGYWNDTNDFATFLRETENRRDPITGQRPGSSRELTQPMHWPEVTVTTQRFLKTARFVNLCRVSVVSPLTGERSELVFTGFSTTLRGARMQRRHPSQGNDWARWDNATGATNDLTLDDTPP